MKMAILLASENNPYAGAVRPFINWANGARQEGICDVEFLLIRVGRKIPEALSGLSMNFCELNNSEELSHVCAKKGYDVILTDDYIERLRILDRIEGKVKKAIYAQILYGIHSISTIYDPLTIREKLIFSAAKMIPFSLLKQRYVKLLKRADVLIANSRCTANFLRVLYGQEPDALIYPPIDGSLFQPYTKKGNIDEVTLYCGSNVGDTNRKLLKRIVELLARSDYVSGVHLFGNKAVPKRMESLLRHSIMHFQNDLEDRQLAEIYSQSILTLSPQEWETFGYVPMESMLCGTPVLAFASQPSSELFVGNETKYLVYSRKAFIERMEGMLGNAHVLHLMKQRCLQRREDLLSNLSCGPSAAKLLSILI